MLHGAYNIVGLTNDPEYRIVGLTNYGRADDGRPRDEAQSRNTNVLLSKM